MGRACPRVSALVYGSEWRLPQRALAAYVYSNFVLSRDGRVSFNEPGHMSGGDVSGFSGHDRWLMALLRARADAILMGDNTLRIEPDHVWTAEHISPEDAEAFAALRRIERRAPVPLQVFLSLDGDVDVDAAAIFSRDDAHVVLATTTRGAAHARSLPSTQARVDVIELGSDSVDVRALLDLLARVRTASAPCSARAVRARSDRCSPPAVWTTSFSRSRPLSSALRRMFRDPGSSRA